MKKLTVVLCVCVVEWLDNRPPPTKGVTWIPLITPRWGCYSAETWNDAIFSYPQGHHRERDGAAAHHSSDGRTAGLSVWSHKGPALKGIGYCNDPDAELCFPGSDTFWTGWYNWDAELFDKRVDGWVGFLTWQSRDRAVHAAAASPIKGTGSLTTWQR
jgi:hypothetical protein